MPISTSRGYQALHVENLSFKAETQHDGIVPDILH